jgi:hypothetical protein
MRFRVSLLVGVAWAVSSASGANAAQFPLGQSTGTGSACGGSGYSELQAGTAASPRYAAPVDGTITSWSFRTNNDTNDVVKLRVFRPTATANQFMVVGDSAAQGPLPANTVNGPFQTAIPVKAGDVLGINIVAGSNPMCLFNSSAGGDVAKQVNPDPFNAGDVATTTTDFTARVNIAATLSAPEPPTGQRAAALKKCKKTAKRKHWSNKRLRKCKKKALLLPM